MRPQLFDSLKNYKKKDIFGDLLAGLMVAIIALPLSIALGIQSVPEGVGMGGIQAGIITAIVAGFFISALGGSKFQIGGPTAAFVVIIFGYLSSPDIGVLGLAIAAMMAATASLKTLNKVQMFTQRRPLLRSPFSLKKPQKNLSKMKKSA